MLPHQSRFTSSPTSASEMIPPRLRHVKWFFTKLLKLQNSVFANALRRITPISIAVLRFLAGSTYFPGHRTRRVVSSSRRQHKGDAVKFPRARVQTPGSHDKKRSLYTMYGGAFSYLSAPNTSPPSMLHFQQAP